MIQMDFLKTGFKRLREFSAFLLIGSAVALIWANLSPNMVQLDGESVAVHTYTAFVEAPLHVWWQGGLQAALQWIAEHEGSIGSPINFHFIVNDVFMVLFFGMAAKEVSESFLPGGALSSLNKAAMPAVATAGGVLGPVAVFFILHSALGLSPDLAKAAWAVPTATDIAYCWLFAGLIFGRAHPAVTFLLVLAVLDDLIGMLIIAVYYTPEVHVAWLGLVVLALVICEVMRRMGVKNFWPYVLIGGPLCWVGLHETGVHAALALVPVVPFMPHAERDSGIFDMSEETHNDTMNKFEHFFAPIVDVGLLTFGLANAGVALNAGSFAGSVTWVIFLALLIGKTAGIFSFSWVGSKFGLELPKPITMPQVVVMGCVAGIGFTVALFVTTVALGLAPLQGWHLPDHVGDMLKLGALLSFAAGPIAWVLAKITGVEKINGDEPTEAAH